MKEKCKYCDADISMRYFVVRKDGEEFKLCKKCFFRNKHNVKFVFEHTTGIGPADGNA